MEIGESTYGSDKAGLVCAYAFAPGGRGRSIDADEVADHVARTGETSPEFLWLHFNLSNIASERWLRRHFSLPDAFHDASKESASTRVEAVDAALLAVINDVEFFAFEPSSVSRVTLYVDQRAMVSARTTPVRALDRLRTSIKAGETFRSPAALLAHLLRDQADVLVEIVRDATTEVDAIEDRIITKQTASRSKLGTLRRVLVRLQRLLAPEPAALFRLLSRPPEWVGEDDVDDLRRSAEELSTAVADSVALVERVRLLQEELTALLNEQTNRTLFVLTMVTVLALPFTIVPGLFGMNVGGIPFAEHGAGFWLVLLALIGVVGIGAAVVRARQRP